MNIERTLDRWHATATLILLGGLFGLAFAAHFAAMRVGPLAGRPENAKIAG